MIDAIQKIGDNLIALAKWKHEARRRLFQDHVEPVYANLKPIVRDFLEVYDLVLQKLPDMNTSLADIQSETKTILGRRWEDRWEITHYVDALYEQRGFPHPVSRFAESVLDILYLLPNERDLRRSGSLDQLLEEAAETLQPYPAREKELREHLAFTMRAFQEEIREFWKGASAEYHELRVRCLR
ncbi:hypothetical protein ACFL2O_07215 [Thermodesulfobacteriota bacterium]